MAIFNLLPVPLPIIALKIAEQIFNHREEIQDVVTDNVESLVDTTLEGAETAGSYAKSASDFVSGLIKDYRRATSSNRLLTYVPCI